jgi:hypothetical protein
MKLALFWIATLKDLAYEFLFSALNVYLVNPIEICG